MAYKIYEGRPPALLQKRGAELLLVCFHELLVAGFAFFGPSRFFALSEQDKGAHSPQALLCPPQASRTYAESPSPVESPSPAESH